MRQIQGNLTEAANATTSDEQRAVLQLEADAAIDALNRIGHSEYNGRRLFDGDFDLESLGGAPDSSLPEISAAALESDGVRLQDFRSGGDRSLVTPLGGDGSSGNALDQYQSQILNARALAGSVERYGIDVGTSLRSSQLEQLSAARSQIEDLDVAAESSRFARNEILLQASFLDVSA